MLNSRSSRRVIAGFGDYLGAISTIWALEKPSAQTLPYDLEAARAIRLRIGLAREPVLRFWHD